MDQSGTIQYIPHASIDRQKWDACIRNANNGLIYAYSFYLDHLAPGWEALVEGDYDTVMPLTANKKFGITYLYQPFLTAQLGVFGKHVEVNTVHRFINAIPPHIRYIDISLNTGNNSYAGKNVWQRSNYVLDLNLPYEELQKNYRDHVRRNLKKSVETGCIVQRNINAEEVISLAVKQMHAHDRSISTNISRFRSLYEELDNRKMALTYGIMRESKLLASCVFFLASNRAYYILVGNDPAGKNYGASHALIDAFIRDHAGKPIVLDFEGSDIKSLAFFYSSFGATHETYPALRINRLPIILKWLKN